MNKVREHRHEQGMAMAELAVKAKVSPTTLVMIERYGYIPGPEMRRRIAAALGVAEPDIWQAD
jgi:DNA-binding XRE family transcriptional regulator